MLVGGGVEENVDSPALSGHDPEAADVAEDDAAVPAAGMPLVEEGELAFIVVEADEAADLEVVKQMQGEPLPDGAAHTGDHPALSAQIIARLLPHGIVGYCPDLPALSGIHPTVFITEPAGALSTGADAPASPRSVIARREHEAEWRLAEASRHSPCNLPLPCEPPTTCARPMDIDARASWKGNLVV